MKKTQILLLGVLSAISTLGLANDALDANCLQLNDQCIYTALKNRDEKQLKKLLNDESVKMLSEKEGLIEAVMQQVPTQDPLSVEIPLDSATVEGQHPHQRIYFYIYPDHAMRLRVIYDSLKPNAKVAGFWVAKIQ